MTENPHSGGSPAEGPPAYQPPTYSAPAGWGAPGQGQPGYDPQPQWGASPPSTMTPSDERLWATLAHGLALVSAWFALGVVVPLVVLAAFGNRSAFVRHHAVESLNFQITALIVGVVGAIAAIVTLGLALLPLIAYGVFYLVVVILAAVRAYNGEWYRYPLTLRLVK